ncbi:MAG: arginine--tRNA ligase, partial [Deltaproteobacteria bacterium]|nr:arginine--tRNA ligase [Deltaproteobacteria bacterium]
MADPELALATTFQRALAGAFGPELAAVDPAIRPSQHADYQANVALALKARLGRPPRAIAEALVAALDAPELIERAEIAGPGFVNVTLRGDALAAGLREIAADPELGLPRAAQPETVVVDYSSPNVAKEMHVGHLRSAIIGDALVRVLEARGHRVIRQNHLGDWGTPFGMLLEHLLDLPGSDADRSMAELGAFYQQARGKFDADPAFAERARRRVVLLQGGDEASLALWRRLVGATVRAAQDLYALLGVTLTEADVAGESFYNPMLPAVIAELREKGLLEESDGALCVFPGGFTGREGAPLPLIVQKQDGGHGYATTDLAAVRHRVGTLGAS